MTTDKIYAAVHLIDTCSSSSYDEERQVTKPTSPLQSCRSRTGFRYSRCRSRAVAPDTIVSSYFREQQLWSGNENVEIRYVNGSFVAGTSALSPGVLRHIFKFIRFRPLAFLSSARFIRFLRFTFGVPLGPDK